MQIQPWFAALRNARRVVLATPLSCSKPSLDTMPVYIRTATGTAAALNPLVKLPRNLRQLLVAIDGETSTSTHAARMANQGNIQVLLDTLQLAGLIRPASPAGAQLGNAAASFQASQPAREPAAPELTPTLSPLSLAPSSWSTLEMAQPPAWSGAMARSSASVAHTDFQTTRTKLEPEFNATPQPDAFAEFGTETAPADLRPTAAGSYELGNVISLMSNFVTQHLPERSLEIVLALESLTSVSHVASSLHDYRALIAPVGDAAHHHLAELQHLLDSA